MRDIYDSGSLSAFVIVIAAFLLFKVLAWTGIAHKGNVDSLSRWIAGVIGTAYACFMETGRSFGPVIDLVARVGGGVIVGFVLFGCLLIAAGGAIDQASKNRD